MAFKLRSPYKINTTPVYHVDEEDGVLGLSLIHISEPTRPY